MQFEDVSLVSGAAYSASGIEQSGMGSAAGDFDGDGDLDFLVTNLQRDYNTLFLNQIPPSGPLRFADETTAAGLNLSTLGFLGSAALRAGTKKQMHWKHAFRCTGGDSPSAMSRRRTEAGI